MDIRGLTRKNYWDYPAINPLLMPDVEVSDLNAFAHEDFSADCRRLFVTGNTEVIFEYVKLDSAALDESWVVATIRRWRMENTPESRARYQRLMKAHFDTHGTLPFPTTVAIILRDQRVFKKIRALQSEHPKLPLRSVTKEDGEVIGGVYSMAADAYNISEESVEEVYKLYRSKADELLGKKPPPLLPRHLLPTRQYDILHAAFIALGLDKDLRVPDNPPLATEDEIFPWLDTMADRLRWLSGG